MAAGEYPFTTLERLTPTSTLKTIVGGYARRGATFSYPSKTAIQAALTTFGTLLDGRSDRTLAVHRPRATLR